MSLHPLSDAGKNLLDAGICAAAGSAFMEWVTGHAATGAAVIAAILGVVRLVDAIVVLYERRTIQKVFGRLQRTRRSD